MWESGSLNPDLHTVFVKKYPLMPPAILAGFYQVKETPGDLDIPDDHEWEDRKD